MKVALLVLAGIALLPLPAGSQGTVQPRPGVRPRREIPGFDFSPHGVWRGRAHRVRLARAQLLAARRFGTLNTRPLAPGILSTNTVSGSLVEPVVLFKFQDTPGGAIVGDSTAYDSVLFAGTPPLGRPYTVRTYYEQLSSINGAAPLMTITGKAFGFVTLDSNEVTYTDVPGTCSGNPYGTTNCNGLFSDPAIQRMQMGLREALQKLDTSVDWTQFTSHGDTLDLVVFAHAAEDGACGGATNNHIWSHRYVLLNPFKTHSIGPGGDSLEVVDYIIESAVGGTTACDPTQIMPVGTVAHETGHAFDLPDLYDTQGTSEGVGEFSLMGSGNYTSPLSPSRMDAWSLSQLGWVNVVPLAAAGTYRFGGVSVSNTVFLLQPTAANPRGEYYLLENRQPQQADSAMLAFHCRISGLPSSCGGGLLVWHLDGTQIADAGFGTTNTVNSGPIHGVELEQADGHRDLDFGKNRGDAGDPFGGASGNAAFLPSLNANPTFAGFQISAIQQVATTDSMPMAFQLSFGPLVLPTSAVVSQLLSGSGLTSSEMIYLDGTGNKNGQFDVGDFSAWVNATGAP